MEDNVKSCIAVVFETEEYEEIVKGLLAGFMKMNRIKQRKLIKQAEATADPAPVKPGAYRFSRKGMSVLDFLYTGYYFKSWKKLVTVATGVVSLRLLGEEEQCEAIANSDWWLDELDTVAVMIRNSNRGDREDITGGRLIASIYDALGLFPKRVLSEVAIRKMSTPAKEILRLLQKQNGPKA